MLFLLAETRPHIFTCFLHGPLSMWSCLSELLVKLRSVRQVQELLMLSWLRNVWKPVSLVKWLFLNRTESAALLESPAQSFHLRALIMFAGRKEELLLGLSAASLSEGFVVHCDCHPSTKNKCGSAHV